MSPRARAYTLNTQALTRPAIPLQELVARKLELAVLSEREVIARRELYKAKEANLKLASKLTKMEAAVYSRR